MGKKVKTLKNHTDFSADFIDIDQSLIGYIDALNVNMAAAGFFKQVQAAQKSAFPGATGADDAYDFTLFDFSGDSF